MSLQMQTMSTGAPFFKSPMTTPQNSNFFLSSSLQSQRQQPTSTQPHTDKTQSQNTRKQIAEVSIEVEQQSSNRLSALHTRLQLEAEKIRKWKNTTEAEIRDKDRKLKEANRTIESQRKTVTDLQLKKESLSSRLRDEVSNQKEIQRKISSTRDMCTALKNHAVRVDDAISKGEQDRSTLNLLHKEKMEKFQGLLVRFQQLESGQKEWMNSQTQLLTEEKEVNAQLRAQCHSLDQYLTKATDEASALREKNREQEELSLKLSKEIDNKSMFLEKLKQDKDSLEQNLSAKESEVNNLKDRLVSLQQQLTGANNQLDKDRGMISNLQDTLEQNKISHAKEVGMVQSELSCYQLKCKELEEMNANLELRLKTTQSELSAEIGSLESQLKDTKQQLALAQESSSSLNEALLNEKHRVELLEADKSSLEDQLAEVLQNMDKQITDLNVELKIRDDRICIMETQLAKQAEEYQTSLAEWKSIESKLKTCISELRNEKSNLSEKVDSLDQELKEFKGQTAKKEAEYTESRESVNHTLNERTIAELRSEKQSACDNILSLKSYNEALSIDKDKLVKQCADMNQLIAENVKLNETVQSQKTQVENLQKELEMIQCDLGSKNGELSELIDKYKKQAEQSETECKQVREQLESQVHELETKCVSVKEELSAVVEKYKIEAENAKEEHEQTKNFCKEQANELCSILEKYREENQCVMTKKDREIESLKKRLDQAESEKNTNEREIAQYKDKVKLLESDLSGKDDELRELLKAVECIQQNKEKVFSTPRQPTKQPSDFITPVHSTNTIDTDEAIVSSTPKPRSKRLSSTIPVTSKGPSRSIKNIVRSTPQRMYNYKVTATPSSSKITRPLPHSGNKAKRMRCHDELEAEEISKFKELYPDTPLEDEEVVFKKPKTKGLSVHKSSSTTTQVPKYSLTNIKNSSRTPLTPHNGRHRKNALSERKKKTEDLSWFDSDSVFGLSSLDD